MLPDCMIIRGAVQQNGHEVAFRPATRAPSMHWAYMLIDSYANLVNISIKWIDGEPMVTITRNLHVEDNLAFEHIMEFAVLHGLDVTTCETECFKCTGHPKCIGDKNEARRAERHRI